MSSRALKIAALAPKAAPALDHDKPIAINIVATTPQVIHCRLWGRVAGGTWAMRADSALPLNVTLEPVPADYELDYWLGIAGNPNDPYRIVATFDQDGQRVDGGTVHEDGTTDNDGVAAIEDEVRLP